MGRRDQERIKAIPPPGPDWGPCGAARDPAQSGLQGRAGCSARALRVRIAGALLPARVPCAMSGGEGRPGSGAGRRDCRRLLQRASQVPCPILGVAAGRRARRFAAGRRARRLFHASARSARRLARGVDSPWRLGCARGEVVFSSSGLPQTIGASNWLQTGTHKRVHSILENPNAPYLFEDGSEFKVYPGRSSHLKRRWCLYERLEG